jgi:hypothetical protein
MSSVHRAAALRRNAAPKTPISFVTVISAPQTDKAAAQDLTVTKRAQRAANIAVDFLALLIR